MTLRDESIPAPTGRDYWADAATLPVFFLSFLALWVAEYSVINALGVEEHFDHKTTKGFYAMCAVLAPSFAAAAYAGYLVGEKISPGHRQRLNNVMVDRE